MGLRRGTLGSPSWRDHSKCCTSPGSSCWVHSRPAGGFSLLGTFRGIWGIPRNAPLIPRNGRSEGFWLKIHSAEWVFDSAEFAPPHTANVFAVLSNGCGASSSDAAQMSWVVTDWWPGGLQTCMATKSQQFLPWVQSKCVEFLFV